MKKYPAVYIMANKPHGTLYTGMIGNLIMRVYQHRHSATQGFTARYDCKRLVYYELFVEIVAAIAREKQIKAGPRKKKIELIEKMNPTWDDLYATLL